MKKITNKVHNLIILDESGSMQAIKDSIISGFNEVVQTVKGIAQKFPEQAHFITFISFNSMDIKTHLDCEPTLKLDEINGEKYLPNSTTPLYDAMGFGINKLRNKLEGEENTNVLVSILTDGLENASKEYNNLAIKALVEEMKTKKWTFTYIGANHNVEDFAASISIQNHIHFRTNKKGMNKMFNKEMKARVFYSQRIRENKDTVDNFYMDEDE